MLPFLNTTNRGTSKQVVEFRGINYSDMTTAGDLRDSKNLSARRYPYLSTRRARAKLEEYSGCTALTARGKLVAVRGTDLLYDGEVVGQVTEGEKQFAVLNTKMVIFPDKVYLDLTTKEMKPLGAKLSGAGGKFTNTGITFTGWDDLTKHFKVGDCITLSGCTVNKANNHDITIKGLTVTEITVEADELKEAEETETLTLERKIPDLDYICESENRLWGCCNATQTIHASALGDPTNFYLFESVSTDSWAVAVGTDGDFTGCCKLSSAVLFWKETKLHKLLGSYPAEYSLYTYEIEGLQKGCHKSMQVINESLYYMGLHGVYSYTGGMPSLVSANFGDKVMTDAVAGNDGDTYYLSVKDGEKWHLFAHETRSGIWVREDDTHVLDFARVGKDLYFLDSNGEVWLADGRTEDAAQEWMAQFTPFYETIYGRKRYSRLLLRVELPVGSLMRAEVCFDDGIWREAGKLVGRKQDSIPLLIPINRCDRFELRLSGMGPCTILAMMLEYQVGSDV